MGYTETTKDKIRKALLQLGDDFGDEEMMEEAIFKAGIREAVEWIEQHTYNSGFIWQEGWQAKLKEWGITLTDQRKGEADEIQKEASSN